MPAVVFEHVFPLR